MSFLGEHSLMNIVVKVKLKMQKFSLLLRSFVWDRDGQVEIAVSSIVLCTVENIIGSHLFTDSFYVAEDWLSL